MIFSSCISCALHDKYRYMYMILPDILKCSSNVGFYCIVCVDNIGKQSSSAKVYVTCYFKLSLVVSPPKNSYNVQTCKIFLSGLTRNNRHQPPLFFTSSSATNKQNLRRMKCLQVSYVRSYMFCQNTLVRPEYSLLFNSFVENN